MNLKEKLALSTPADCVVPVLYPKPPPPPTSEEIAAEHVRNAVEAASKNASKGFVILEEVYEESTDSMLCLRADLCHQHDCRRCTPLEKKTLLLKVYLQLVTLLMGAFRLIQDTRCEIPLCGKNVRACWKEHALPNFRPEKARSIPARVYEALSDTNVNGFNVEAVDASKGNQLLYKFRISWR
ncbi:MAG: hypothetical protein K2X77_23655 [Candidatus Obscuribacterales bacterium]|jgi:hypothetical protein|nr:hypothetical protein [Candidatus Obscuribacterales bacterium]